MRLLTGIFLVVSTLFSVVILLIANSVVLYLLAIVPIVIAFFLSKALSEFHEKERVRILASRQTKNEKEKLLNHISDPFDYVREKQDV